MALPVPPLPDDIPPTDVRPYVFGQSDTATRSDFYALQMVNERFCRIARNVFLPMLRIQPRLNSMPPRICSFEDYRAGQSTFVSITTSRLEELRGTSLLVIPPGFIWMLTDAYYGGTIRNIKSSRTEFTASEHRVIEIVSERLNEAAHLAWRDLTSMTFTATNHEENMQFAAFVDSEDMVVVCSFMLQLPGTDEAKFDVIYPLHSLRPISTQLRSRIQSDFVDDDNSWRERLERAILEVPLKVSVRLCEPEIPLRQLMALRSGEVVPVSVAEHADVLVEGQRLFLGQSGNLNGQSALRISGRAPGTMTSLIEGSKP